jgi:predicted flap endonuclease-1-like 5' DNA nuclease
MTTLTWETLLLLALAYFAGCCVGCLARRRARAARAPARQAAPQQAAAEPLVLAAEQQPPLQARAAPDEAMVRPVVEVKPLRVATTVDEPFQRADPTAPEAKPEPIIEPPDPVQQSTAAVARFTRAISGDGPVVGPTEASAGSAIVEEAPASDDLKRVRAIDAALEQRLRAFGVTTFAQMAQWTAADVLRLSRELGFKGRIQRENWIEQAQVLAKGGETVYARRVARGEAAAARPVDDEGEPRPLRSDPAGSVTAARAPEGEAAGEAVGRAPLVEPAGQPARPAVGLAPDNLQRISGINAEIEKLLAAQDVTRYGQIAGWSPSDVQRLDRLLGQEGRIARENWIEQAQILAKGGDTAYSREHDRRAGVVRPSPPKLADAVRAHTESEANAVRESGSEADVVRADVESESDRGMPAHSSDIASLRSVRSQALRGTDTGTPPSARMQRSAVPDDLKRIRGIGVLIEKRLQAIGVTAYAHMAEWTAADIDRVSELLDFKGRIERENWIEQARILASGGQTEFSRRVDRGEVTTSRPRQT